MDLSNKTIVITGASKGLGRELAFHLSRKNANLILIARTKYLLENIQTEIKKITGRIPMIIACDISKENDVEQMTGIINEKYKTVDILINNAGIGVHKNLENIKSDDMRRQFEINFYGVFYCTKALLPLIKNSNAGYILNIGSLVSKIPFADNSIYAATKSAISGFSEGFRYEVKRRNIKVGLFLPGIMNTTFQEDREDGAYKAPAFLTINTQKVAVLIEKIIYKRKKKVVMYRWMLIFMKIKQLLFA